MRCRTADGKFIQVSTRCVYRNDDILVQHAFMSWPANTKDAVMFFGMLKKAVAIPTETDTSMSNLKYQTINTTPPPRLTLVLKVGLDFD